MSVCGCGHTTEEHGHDDLEFPGSTACTECSCIAFEEAVGDQMHDCPHCNGSARFNYVLPVLGSSGFYTNGRRCEVCKGVGKLNREDYIRAVLVHGKKPKGEGLITVDVVEGGMSMGDVVTIVKGVARRVAGK